MEKQRSIFEVQLGSKWPKTADLPQEVLESCRESLQALKAALESGAFERAVSSGVPAEPSPAVPAR
jgi:hypothetical protein